MKEFLILLKRFDFKNIFISPTKNVVIQFFRYLFIGGIATIVDWSILFILTEFIFIHYLLSAIIAFIAGLIINFILSKLFVFKSNEVSMNLTIEFTIYSIIGIVGLSITELIIFIFTNYIELYYMLSKMIATIIVLFWNYIARKLIIYKK